MRRTLTRDAATRDVRSQAELRLGRLERFLAYGALLFTALIPSFSKAYSQGDAPPDSALNQVVWGSMYLFTAIRVYTLLPSMRFALNKSTSLLLFGFFMLSSTLWSVDQASTLKQSVEMIGTMIVGLYLVLRFEVSQLLNMLAVVFAVIATASLGLVIIAPARGRMFYGGGPWSGIYQEKNLLGAAMALGIFSLFILLLSKSKWEKIPVLGVLTLCAILLIGSNSITSSLDCIVVIFISSGLLIIRSPKYGLVARIIFAFLVPLCALLLATGGINSSTFFGTVGRSEDLTGRTDFWPALSLAIGDRPILGYGYDAFFTSPIAKEYLADFLAGSGGWTPYHAHDSALQLLLNGGVVGLVLCIVILSIGIKRAILFFKVEKSPIAIWPLSIFVYLLVGSYSESYLVGYNSFESVLMIVAFFYPIRKQLLLGSVLQLESKITSD